MNKFDFKDDDVQGIEFNKNELVKDFFNHNIDFWKQDIYKFNNYMKNVTPDIIEKIYIWTNNITDRSEDFKIDIYLNDGTKRDLFYCNYDLIINWLKDNDLIE